MTDEDSSKRPGPPQWATMTVALAALVPYIATTSGGALFRPGLASGLGASSEALLLVQALSTGGYAFGAFLAGDLVQRHRQRHLFLLFQVALILGWLTCALAGGITAYGAGLILAGTATGLQLVTALPPTIRNYPAARVPRTAGLVSFGLFGGIAAGPLLGGVVAGSGGWRELFLGFVLVGLATLALAWHYLPNQEPPNPELKRDHTALWLGLAATLLPFFGAGQLASRGFTSPLVLVPAGVGLAALAALLVLEFRRRDALAPVRLMSSTLPVIGTLVAMGAGGAFVTFTLLATGFLTRSAGMAPLTVGLTLSPLLAGALAAAIALARMVAGRLLPLLVLGGLVALLAGGAMLAMLGPSPNLLLLEAGVALLGFGAGATVSPALFLAGLSMSAALLGRIFALIELIRSVSDFILAPVMTHIADGAGDPMHGYALAMWTTLGLTLALALLVVALYLLGGVRAQRPDLEAWLGQKGPALTSPPLLAAVAGDRLAVE